MRGTTSVTHNFVNTRYTNHPPSTLNLGTHREVSKIICDAYHIPIEKFTRNLFTIAYEETTEMRLKHINQLKKCVRTYQNVEVFKFHMGNGEYSSVWCIPEKDYDPVDRISQILFDISIKGRSLTTCSIQNNILLGKRVFVIGSSITKDYSTNIDADLVDFFVNQVKERQRRVAIQRELTKDIPHTTLH